MMTSHHWRLALLISLILLSFLGSNLDLVIGKGDVDCEETAAAIWPMAGADNATHGGKLVLFSVTGQRAIEISHEGGKVYPCEANINAGEVADISSLVTVSQTFRGGVFLPGDSATHDPGLVCLNATSESVQRSFLARVFCWHGQLVSLALSLTSTCHKGLQWPWTHILKLNIISSFQW